MALNLWLNLLCYSVVPLVHLLYQIMALNLWLNLLCYSVVPLVHLLYQHPMKLVLYEGVVQSKTLSDREYACVAKTRTLQVPAPAPAPTTGRHLLAPVPAPAPAPSTGRHLLAPVIFHFSLVTCYSDFLLWFFLLLSWQEVLRLLLLQGTASSAFPTR